MVLNSYSSMRGNPIGSHWSMGSFASAAGTCLTPGPEGLLALSASRPKGVYCRGCIMPVSSGRPPSTPCPRGASNAGCSKAPLGWRPPSSSAASQIPEMSRRGAGADFFPAYAGLIGGMLFHFSGLASSPAALGAADCAPRTGEIANPASRATTEITKHLDISEILSAAGCGLRLQPAENFDPNPVLLILNLVAPRVEFSDLLGGPVSCGESPEPSARPKQSFFWLASQVAEKVLSFVGRAFRHDIQSPFSSGVLTPEGPDTHISATCSAAEVESGAGSTRRRHSAGFSASAT